MGLFPDAKLMPVSLDEFPDLTFTHEVFLACADPTASITPMRIQKGKEGQRGLMLFCFSGKGIVFLNVSGVVTYKVLQPREEWFCSTRSFVCCQRSCLVSQEKAFVDDKAHSEIKLIGPGLIIAQSLPTKGRTPDRWGIAVLAKQKVVPVPPGVKPAPK